MERNEAALNSETYNPEVPKKNLELYKLMNYSDPKLIAQYKETVLAQSTHNPYAGVLSNPRSCEIDQNKTMLETTYQLLEERWKEIQAAGQAQYGSGGSDGSSPVETYTPTPAQAQEYAEWSANYPAVRQDVKTAIAGLGDFQTHTDRQIANLPGNIGLAQHSMGMNTLLLGLLNPCLGLDAFFGSLMEMGRKLMAELAAAIQKVLDVINEIMAKIQEMIQKIMKVIQDVIQMIQNEISALVNALIGMLRDGLAWLLGWLPNDPCLKAIVGMVATGAAQKVLGGGKASGIPSVTSLIR